MVHFVGAGPGAPDLITVRGQRLLQTADCVIYAGSLVNPELLENCRDDCEIFNSAHMTLEEVIFQMKRQEEAGHETVRLHTGDPCIYGAIREQMDALERLRIPYEDVPGVSSFCGAAAALNLEYTLPGLTQTVILTRMEGRTKVPDSEKIRSLAAHGSSMVVFLSAAMTGRLSEELVQGGYAPDTPAAIVYKATWPDEKTVRCTVGTLPEAARENRIDRTALIIVSEALRYAGVPEKKDSAGKQDVDTAEKRGEPGIIRETAEERGGKKSGEAENPGYERSRLYDPSFTTGYRKAQNFPEGHRLRQEGDIT